MDYSRYHYLSVERKEKVLIVALNRPESLNAINAPLHTEISQIFADIARAHIGVAGAVGRWGGDEFVAVLYNTNREIAATVGERIQVALERAAADIDGRLVSATVSTGMAFSSHGSFELPAMLLKADQALYRAKADGRNRLAIAMPEAVATHDEEESPPDNKVVRIRRRNAAA